MTIPVEITINGKSCAGEVEPRQLLVHFIRENVGLTGTKVGCDTSQCGSCTVQLDGVAAKSCTVLTVQASGSSVNTIEGISDGVDLHPLQEAFWNNHGLQCGFCTPGMIMAAAELLRSNPSPTRKRLGTGWRATSAAAPATRTSCGPSRTLPAPWEGGKP